MTAPYSGGEGVLEARLRQRFWSNVVNYEKEAIIVAGLFGHTKKIVKYVTCTNYEHIFNGIKV